jgi:Na+/serine symporter
MSNKQQISSNKKLKAGICKKEYKYVSKRTFHNIRKIIKSVQIVNKDIHKLNKKAQTEFKKIILQKIKGNFVDSLDALIAEIWFEETVKRCIESETKSQACILKICEEAKVLPLISAMIDPCSLSKKSRQELVESLSKELGLEFVPKSCDESKKGLILQQGQF